MEHRNGYEVSRHCHIVKGLELPTPPKGYGRSWRAIASHYMTDDTVRDYCKMVFERVMHPEHWKQEIAIGCGDNPKLTRQQMEWIAAAIEAYHGGVDVMRVPSGYSNRGAIHIIHSKSYYYYMECA